LPEQAVRHARILRCVEDDQKDVSDLLAPLARVGEAQTRGLAGRPRRADEVVVDAVLPIDLVQNQEGIEKQKREDD
jgi:hypothetical protein